MRVLLIKTSSMGDVIHTLPALSDAAKAIPNIKFDWVVEKNFAAIPTWHAQVNKVVPIAIRRWRKDIFAKETRVGLQTLRKELRATDYDLVLDAQGLVKSAFVTLLSKGQRVGLDWSSAREPLASLSYQKKYSVNFYQHAIVRMRSLFSLALNYPLPMNPPDFGIDVEKLSSGPNTEKYIVFLHGTTWESKQWPEASWIELAALAKAAGYVIKTSGGNQAEVAASYRIAAGSDNVEVVNDLNILGMARVLANASGAVAVDTGFGHLAAAMNIPTVSIYGSTNPEFTGALGNYSHHLSVNFPCAPCLRRACKFKAEPAPCYATVTPEKVWDTLQTSIRG